MAYYITLGSLMSTVLMLIGLLLLLIIRLAIPAKAILGGEERPAKINPRIKIPD